MGMVLIDQAILALALQALRRDAAEGKTIRGEIADELEQSCRAIGEPVGVLRSDPYDGHVFEPAKDWPFGKPLYVLPTHNSN
ncbi:MAG: hypothetical protein NDI84_02775 [Steroidobacteraceae bacterium]|nr:hypothetical protein [Steroidobacteraceae bacterium]